VNLNVDKILAFVLQCCIVCFSGKDFKSLCDVRLQYYFILDFFSQSSEVVTFLWSF